MQRQADTSLTTFRGRSGHSGGGQLGLRAQREGCEMLPGENAALLTEIIPGALAADSWSQLPRRPLPSTPARDDQTGGGDCSSSGWVRFHAPVAL